MDDFNNNNTLGLFYDNLMMKYRKNNRIIPDVYKFEPLPEIGTKLSYGINITDQNKIFPEVSPNFNTNESDNYNIQEPVQESTKENSPLFNLYQSPQALVDNDLNSSLFLAGQSLAFNSDQMVDNPDLREQAKTGNILRGVGAVGSSLLNIAKAISAGAGYQKRLQYFKNQKAANERDALVNNYKYKEGGSVKDFPVEKMLTGEYAVSLPKNIPTNANAEVERDEFIQYPNGEIQMVVGDRHKDGGVLMELEEGTRVLSDSLKVGKEFAKILNEEYHLNIKPEDSYAKVLKKYTKKLKLDQLNEEQEELFKKLKNQENTNDEATYKLNSLFLGNKIREIEEEKLPLEQERSHLFNLLFEKQEASKSEASRGNKLKEGGIYHTKEFKDLCNKYNLSTERAIDIITKYQEGGELEEESSEVADLENNSTQENNILNNLDNIILECITSGQPPEVVMEMLLSSGVPEEIAIESIQKNIALLQELRNQDQEVDKVIDPAVEVINTPQYEDGGTIPSPYIKGKKYGREAVKEALESWKSNIPNYAYKNLPAERQRLKEFANDYGIALPKGFENFNQTQLNNFAGLLQKTVVDNFGELTKHYGTNIPPTKQGLETLLEMGMPKKLIPSKLFTPNGKIRIGTKTKDISSKDIEKITNWAKDNLSDEQLSKYAVKNFNDNKFYYRYPSKSNVYFNDKDDYKNYLEEIKDDTVGNGVYYARTEGKYLQPILIQPKEFESQEDLNKWVDLNKDRTDKEHQGVYAEEGDKNTFYYPVLKIQEIAPTTEEKGKDIPKFIANTKVGNHSVVPFFPNQETLTPDSIIPHLKIQRQYQRIDPVKVSPEENIKEIYRNTDFAANQANELPDSQRRAMLANITATSQEQINKAISDANRQNALFQQSADQFNISQDNREVDANAEDLLNYEGRMLTALDKTLQDYNNYFDFNRRVRLSKYNYAQKQNMLNNLFSNYKVNEFGNIEVDTDSFQPLRLPIRGNSIFSRLRANNKTK